MKFRNIINHDPKTIKREKINMPSCTVPDQSMSIREILARFARGIPITGNITQFDDQETLGELDGIDFRTLDISEQQAYIQEKKDELTALKETHNRNIAEKQKAKIIREHEEKLKRLKEQQTPLAPNGNVSGGNPVQ